MKPSAAASDQAPCTLDRAWADAAALAAVNAWLEARDAEARVRWSLAALPGVHVLSSSFGAQAAVALHLVTRYAPDIPVLLVDTGYLFPETYRFADQLTARLRLRLHVVHAEESAAWFEARHGRLWEQGLAGLERYHRLRKVEPMQRAMDRLGVRTWIAGLRRSQAESRRQRQILERAGTRWKFHPLVDWSDRDVGRYLARHHLPWHPLWERGYVSIGDVHSTRSLVEAGDLEHTRGFGLKRECGLHE